MGYPAAKTSQQKGKAYVPDLAAMQSQCEINYWLIQRILPSLFEATGNQESSAVNDDKQSWRFASNAAEIRLALTERSRYTTTMNMWIKNSKVKLAPEVKLIIRLYHDARMLEVMEGSGPAAMQAVYQHPNHGMKTKDEKSQVNRYVGECLQACLSAQSERTAGTRS